MPAKFSAIQARATYTLVRHSLLLGAFLVLSSQSSAFQTNGSRYSRIATATNTANSSLSTASSSSAPLTIQRVNQLTGFIPASRVELEKLAQGLQTAVKNKDIDQLCSYFSHEALLNRILVNVALSKYQRSEFERGYVAFSPFHILMKTALLPDSNFSLVRIIRRGNELRPLFRIYSTDAGLAYNEFVVQSNSSGMPKIVDGLAYTANNYLSLSTRPLAVGPFLSDESRERISSSGIESSIIDSANATLVISNNISTGKMSNAVAAFERLQPPLKTELSMVAMKVILAKNVGRVCHQNAIRDLTRLYPNHLSTDLAMLDFYRTTGQSEKQLMVADRLLQSIQDPYIHCFRIAGLLKQNRIQQAREAIALAKQWAPDRTDVYVAEIGLLMKLKNHQQTAKAIEQLERRFGTSVLKLASFPEFDEFADSEIGHRFLGRRAGFDI